MKGAKVVGIAQRRTREGARFLTVAHLSFDAAATVELLALGDAERDDAVQEIAERSAGLKEAFPVRSFSPEEESPMASIEAALIRALP